VPETHFDEWIAHRYKILWPELFDPAVVEPTVDFLAELAGVGPALELGVGTGRIALPLTRRGVSVHGIELSPAMAAQLQAQPGARFVIENYVPALQRLPAGETTHVFTATTAHVGFEEYDVAAQIAFSHHYWVIDGELKTFSSPHRYVWPSEWIS
jgi:hypothetical protein